MLMAATLKIEGFLLIAATEYKCNNNNNKINKLNNCQGASLFQFHSEYSI